MSRLARAQDCLVKPGAVRYGWGRKRHREKKKTACQEDAAKSAAAEPQRHQVRGRAAHHAEHAAAAPALQAEELNTWGVQFLLCFLFPKVF